jgi:phospholipid N-methyltransferase
MAKGDTLFFIRRFLQQPGRVAALAPSSRSLARAMLRGVALDPGDVVVELGPGTGSFTALIAPHVARGVRYLGIERDPVFHARLCETYPSLRFALGSAEDAPELLAEAGHARANLVVSGLPLAAMHAELQQRIVDATRAILAENGVFRQFSYVHFFPFPGSIGLRRKLRTAFSRLELSRPVLANLPPAFVYHGAFQ